MIGEAEIAEVHDAGLTGSGGTRSRAHVAALISDIHWGRFRRTETGSQENGGVVAMFLSMVSEGKCTCWL